MAGYTENELAKDLADKEYQYGFVSDIDSDVVPAGLTEQIIHLISSKKNEPSWLVDYRLKAFEVWKTMKEPDWAHVSYKNQIFKPSLITRHPNKPRNTNHGMMWILK